MKRKKWAIRVAVLTVGILGASAGVAFAVDPPGLDQGSAPSQVAYARLGQGGVLDETRSKNVVALTRAGDDVVDPVVFCFDLTFVPKNMVVTLEDVSAAADGLNTVGVGFAGTVTDSPDCPGREDAYLYVERASYPGGSLDYPPLYVLFHG